MRLYTKKAWRQFHLYGTLPSDEMLLTMMRQLANSFHLFIEVGKRKPTERFAQSILNDWFKLADIAKKRGLTNLPRIKQR